ncbi:MAG: peptidoglycan-binding protein [Eubacterium sp.]|nr:peptidoglycan-binding protein [Eubacterium sp.]
MNGNSESAETYFGTLQVNVTTAGYLKPIEGATVQIVFTGDPAEPPQTTLTDESGQTPMITLVTPPLSYSMTPREYQPYSLYTIRVSAPGYIPIEISGIEIFPGQTAIQNVSMDDEGATSEDFETIVLPANTLYASYPPKIPEDEIKTVSETGEIVLSRVVIPEYIIVHDGPPSDRNANNYYVRYTDYIKNVASSEIYATWPDATLRANILAIQSFTLNRVYTEWYRNQGFDFTITSSTAYDHKWNYGQTIYQSISQIVDELFTNFLSRPNVRQPILTQYCDGRQVTCDGWMSQWGSKYLGDRGYSAIEILRYYYGSDIYINTAEEVSGVPASWPRVTLTVGSSGSKVRQIQEELNAISRSYPAIPRVTADGIYGSQTQNAVRKFQSIFGLPVTGDIDYSTWYKISAIYVATTRIAELR